MQIGILQCGVAPDSLRAQMGDYPDMFMHLLDGHGFDFRTYHAEGGTLPASIDEADGWLITGARHGVYEPHPWILPLEALIREIYAAGLPLIGICFGHQLIAQALGGKVEKFQGGWSVGAQDYDFEGDTIRLNAWHQDQVITPPEGARTIGSSAFCEHAALLYGDRAYSVQAHPEFRDEFVEGLINTRAKGVVPDALLAEASAQLGAPNDSAVIAQRIAEFFLAAQDASKAAS